MSKPRSERPPGRRFSPYPRPEGKFWTATPYYEVVRSPVERVQTFAIGFAAPLPAEDDRWD